VKRLILLAMLLCAAPLLAVTTWYATSSSVNVNTTGLWKPTHSGTCTATGTALVWGAQATGDTFNANGCTSLAVNVDMGGAAVQVTLSTVTYGGGFTLATADLGTMVTLHAHIIGGTTTTLTITGSTGCGTISGNITGSAASSGQAVSDSHTACTVTVAGNVTGGTTTGGAYGLVSSSTGPLVITGTVSPGSAATSTGMYLQAGATATVGTCQGSNTVTAAGCNALSSSTSLFIVTGNIINGLKSQGITGPYFWTPAAATNYILSPKDASYTLGVNDSHATMAVQPPAASDVRNTVVYGPSPYTGTYVCAGGGVCATGSW